MKLALDDFGAASKTKGKTGAAIRQDDTVRAAVSSFTALITMPDRISRRNQLSVLTFSRVILRRPRPETTMLGANRGL
jgi:hypothetical protein